MTDKISKESRSHNLSRIRSRDTAPEKKVRSLLHVNGFRFRLYGKVSKRIYPTGVLPGKPDIVLAGRLTVLFVHGCFWHSHKGCRRAVTPKSNQTYWSVKLKKNKERDKAVSRKLRKLGFRVLTVWECQTVDPHFGVHLIEMLGDKF